MISRRQLFVAAASGVAGLAGLRYLTSNEEDGIVAVLRKRLDYLVLDEPGVRAFAADLAAHNNVRGSKLRLIDATEPVYSRLPTPANAPSSTLAHKLEHGEARIVSLYLLSSDFFANGADETRPVRYVSYYDPMDRVRPCGNPFARPPSV
jgi:hypothetical protein